MTTELSTADRRYEALLDRLCAAHIDIESQNLERYHAIGTIFSEFIKGVDGKKYGNATVDKLVEDLKSRNVLSAELKDPKRYLYWAKNISDSYPDAADLQKMAAIGFTVSHAKRLFALSAEARTAVVPEMVSSGRFVSVRQLDELIANKTKEATAARLEAVTRPPSSQTASEVGAEPATVATSTADASDAAPALDVGGEDDEAPEAPRPARASATGLPTVRERSVGNPLKVLGSIEKTLSKAGEGLPDAFIVIRESAQIGFDSDTALAKYLSQLHSLAASAKLVVEPLLELQRLIMEEVEAARALKGK